jgi:hypothetical protein
MKLARSAARRLRIRSINMGCRPGRPGYRIVTLKGSGRG